MAEACVPTGFGCLVMVENHVPEDSTRIGWGEKACCKTRPKGSPSLALLSVPPFQTGLAVCLC